MDKYTQKLFDFVTSDEDRFETANALVEKWGNINAELINAFARDIGKEVRAKVGDEFTVSTEDNYWSVYISKKSWRYPGVEDPVFMIACEDLNTNPRLGLWQNNNNLKNKKAWRVVLDYVKSSYKDRYGLELSTNYDWWILHYQADGNFSEIEWKKKLLPAKRSELVKEYAQMLCNLVEDLAPHVDHLFQLVYPQ